MVQYIADQVPAKNIAPAPGSLERYRLGEWLSFINSEIHKSFGPLFDKNSPDETKATAKKRIDKRFNFIDQKLAQHDYLMGSAFTVADGYLYVMLRWARQLSLDLSQYPALAAFITRMQQRPAVNAALAAEGIPAV